MGRFPHKLKSNRRVMTIQELAMFYGVNRDTMAKYLKEYGDYDLHDSHSFIQIIRFLDKKFYGGFHAGIN